MLAINNLSYHIGGRALYDGANLHIKPKDKIGLIGLNGTGKSTLLRLIDGEYQPDGGEITKANDCTIGFLNQDLLSFQSDDSILNVAMQAFEEALEIEHKIEKVLKKMETDYEDKLVSQLTRLQEQFEVLEGYTLQARAEEILEGIGFSTNDLRRPLREFSGGWRMRVMLAKLLLEKPSLLMLDEPTNHLDLPSIQWVEDYLRSYEGAFIIVSHDQQFLDNTIDTTVEVSHAQLTTYAGNYSFYLEERELRREIQKNAFENQQQKIKQTERFIERFRSKATKARQVQSRVKMLDRMDKVSDVVDENATVNFKFTFNKPSGRQVVAIKDATKRYGDLTILQNSHCSIERGDKIALIGANGKGKSTLLRMVAGTEEFKGERDWGYNVEMAFYAQHQLEALSLDNEILEELKQAGSEKTEQELRNVLGCFLFLDEDVFKKIKVLSGGEKSRVALARTLISESNFLLLDEPTNHLDIQSVNILVQALQQYQGTFLIVSHDRHFISRVANKIWYIESKEVKEYPGTYQEYSYWQSQREASQPTVLEKKPPAPKPKKEPSSSRLSDVQRNLQRDLKKLQQELETVETTIGSLEKEKKAVEQQLANPLVFGNVERLAEETEKFEQVDQQLSEANQQWENLALQVEEIEAKLNND
ncbi:ribosomal protection-like ABC-F family protein [Tunicatimonas pelagia]|uniref:ribosomal protection-like ABC-F family protein n=1 Tax=Tunicatimonas pelagia TaxID=931531 RepID=UPI002666F36B|nr:ABC-F family ATP-binding cassette domain-containing protein [Tunicatimonas pelagia]WKN41106.1 ABC-F family ATP-binding cassette domain-containing protein [Tunicatimonas pelagia]